MEKEIKSFIDIDVIDNFPSEYPKKSFFNYVSNIVGVESVLAVAGMFAPELVNEDGCIFLKENYPIIINNNLYDKFGSDTKNLERYVNLFCVSDFYLMAADDASQNDFLLLQFAKVIKCFWGMYLQSQFPDKLFDIELSENGLFDEDGICLTFSQRIG